MSHALCILPLLDLSEIKVGHEAVPVGQLYLSHSEGVYCQVVGQEGFKQVFEPRLLPKDMKVFVGNDTGFGFTDVDGWGEKLKFALAKDLKKLDMTLDGVTQLELATKAYVDALPNSTPIVLYWN